ncbi:FAD-binding oxidoreductase [Pararhodobacter sp. SW119]|uniref:FAD-dependent oxidoreductase n=1 Tax=Pararhodobacter sp. SW119 TaxID=2780075 RepID=UPI001ADF7755|nr:FAD-binding oxidoreductase [Pararhodobacter sp. SW119]
MTQLSGWGRYPRIDCALSAPRDADALARALARGPAIARGMGRAYGDSALNAANTVSMGHFNRFLAFDPATGTLEVEAGVTLAEVIAAFLPRGWFPQVTPGTKFVSLGGAIAADVHGKNHHGAGSFGAALDWIDVMGADGTVTRASHDTHSDLFHWTLGSMGLTGVILRAGLRLQPVESGWIAQTTLPAPSLSAAIDAFEGNLDAPYSVAWIDCTARGPALGRSLVMLGRHAGVEDLPPAARRAPFDVPRRRARSLPVDLPAFALNPLTLRAFNAAYWWAGNRKAGAALVDWDRYFYPLDAVAGWNRLYGRRGFLQFQCVLPLPAAAAGLDALLRAIAARGAGSFLAVLKRFGAQDSRLSFPMEGYTLALDFPHNRESLTLMDRLDRITADHGGRFYLAKDARLDAATLHATDPRWSDFAQMRQKTGLAEAFASAQSQRLAL